MHIDISVVTVVKNNISGIARTLDSIARQKSINIEHVIIDGNSIDGTLDMINCTEEPCHITRRVVSEADGGIYDALNKGIARCEGELVAILHSGDVYHCDDTLQKIVDKFRSTEKIDFLYGDAVFVNKNNKVCRYYKSYKNFQFFMNLGLMPAHTSLVVRKNILKKLGEYSIKYKIASDFDFFVRIYLDKSIRGTYFQNPLVVMLVGGASNSGFTSSKIIYQEKLQILKEYNFNFSNFRLLCRYIFLIPGFVYLLLYRLARRSL